MNAGNLQSKTERKKRRRRQQLTVTQSQMVKGLLVTLHSDLAASESASALMTYRLKMR